MLLHHRLDRLLRRWTCIPQIHQRRESIVSCRSKVHHPHLASDDLQPHQIIQLVLKLQHHPLGRLLADPRNLGQYRQVVPPDRPHQPLRRDPAQHRNRQLRPNPAHPDQPFKQPLLLHIAETEQRNLVLPHIRIDMEHHLSALCRKLRKRCHRNTYVIPHTCALHHRLVGSLAQKPSTKMRDHAPHCTSHPIRPDRLAPMFQPVPPHLPQRQNLFPSPANPGSSSAPSSATANQPSPQLCTGNHHKQQIEDHLRRHCIILQLISHMCPALEQLVLPPSA